MFRGGGPPPWGAEGPPPLMGWDCGPGPGPMPGEWGPRGPPPPDWGGPGPGWMPPHGDWGPDGPPPRGWGPDGPWGPPGGPGGPWGPGRPPTPPGGWGPGYDCGPPGPDPFYGPPDLPPPDPYYGGPPAAMPPPFAEPPPAIPPPSTVSVPPPGFVPPGVPPPGMPPVVPPPGVPPPGMPPVVPPPGLPPPGLPPPGMPPPVVPLGIPPPPVTVPPPMPFASYPPPAFPPPGWTAEATNDVMVNAPPDQPEWIKALLVGSSAPDKRDSAPPTPAVVETKIITPPTKPPPTAVSPPAEPENKVPAKPIGLLRKMNFEKPPPGRSTGIISYIGSSFGYIERDDLIQLRYTFSFDAFFGNPKAMVPGVRVHFTACTEKIKNIATDVKVAPGGTENIDMEIYEGVVSLPINEPQTGEKQYPGQVHVTIGPLRTNVVFEKKDCSGITLLKNDQVLLNLCTDIVTEKKRATNIRPKVPSTFEYTEEKRETGVILTLRDVRSQDGTIKEGVIKSEEHGELVFNVNENLSDVDFCLEDVNEEVEFTVMTVKDVKRAVRVKRSKEPLLLMLSTSAPVEKPTAPQDRPLQFKYKPFVLDTEVYEGIVSQTIIEPTVRTNHPKIVGYPGQIFANIGPIRTNVTFDHRDCGVTLLKNDHVLINLLIDKTTGKRRAANIKPKIPFTFNYTKEKREKAVMKSLGKPFGKPEGVLKSEEHGELPFDITENFSDTEFGPLDVDKEVEFTMTDVKQQKRAIRLRRMEKDKIQAELKRLEDEAKKAIEEKERERQEQLKREEEEKQKKAEVAAALAAAKVKWTPLGFKFTCPDSMDEISKERFEGTVLKAIPKSYDKDPEEQKQVEVKQEKMEDKGDEEKVKEVGGEEKKLEVKPNGEKPLLEVKKEKEEVSIDDKKPEESEKSKDADVGRLVMTVAGEQKQLLFKRRDLLCIATMMVGDKVRFNIATHKETKEERATYVEILPDSFEESTEQRRHGIVIEFAEDSGYIKSTQNPQLYFHMTEVIERKKLELNEKVEFSVVPHETAEGGLQAIRIKRFTEKVFLPVRKLGGVGATKAKMGVRSQIQIILNKESELLSKESESKLKAVVKNLRAQDSKTSSGQKGSSTGRSRGSKSPPRDKFGRYLEKRRSPSPDRGAGSSSSSRYKSRERDRSYRKPASRSRSRSGSRSRGRRSRSRSRSGSGSRSRARRSRSRTHSRSRSRERSKDRAERKKRRSNGSPEREMSRKRTREEPRRSSMVEDELARKKRELDELNQMIAYKKALVEPPDPSRGTCIDYGHGRLPVPVTEYKPPRSILKKRADSPDYGRYPPSTMEARRPYDERDRPYNDPYGGPYQERERPHDDPYGDRYRERPYGERPFDTRYYDDRPYNADRPYADRPYHDRPYASGPGPAPSAPGPAAGPAPAPYTDRYDVYDDPYEDRHYDRPYGDQPKYASPYDPPPSERHQDPSQPLPPQHALPPQPTQTSVPTVASYPAEPPNSTSYTNAPSNSSYTQAPSGGSYPNAPSNSSYSNAPSSTSYSNAPSSTSYSNAPSSTSYSNAPSSTSYTNAPSSTSYTNAPSSTSYTNAPSSTSYTNAPSSTSYTNAPSNMSYTHAPSGSSYTQSSYTHAAAPHLHQQSPPFRPPSPKEPPPRSPSPRRHNSNNNANPFQMTSDHRSSSVGQTPPESYAPPSPTIPDDGLLPHERAVQDGSGFSRLFSQDHSNSNTPSRDGDRRMPLSPTRSPRRLSSERAGSEDTKTEEPYDKIQSLLRSIGLKLSTGDVSKLASRAQEKHHATHSDRSSVSSERELRHSSLGPTLGDARRSTSRSSDRFHSPSPSMHSPSPGLEPLGRGQQGMSEYEGFLDQLEMEAFKRAREMQRSLTSSIGGGGTPERHSTPHAASSPPPDHNQPQPIAAHYGWGSHYSSSSSSTNSANMAAATSPPSGQATPRFATPPGPPPGPPPRRTTPGVPRFAPPPTSSDVNLPFLGQAEVAETTPPPPPKASQSSASEPMSNPAIATTVARCLKVIETVKTLAEAPAAATPDAKPDAKNRTFTKSVRFSGCPTNWTEPASRSEAKEGPDEVRTKQKEKLDQYNQRQLDKKEQRIQGLRQGMKQGMKRPDANAAQTGPKNVWICGHSLVYWAESRAKSPEVGMQLGMNPNNVVISWKGTQGMTWPQLLPLLHQLKVKWPNPDVLIIHLGGNDMSTDSPTDLLASVKKDLTSMRSIFPQCLLVWSNILPRRLWRHSPDAHDVDLVRTTVNRRIHSIITELGGTSLTHDNIRCGTNTGLYRADGVHLSSKGIDTFNLNLQDFLEKWEMEVNKGS